MSFEEMACKLYPHIYNVSEIGNSDSWGYLDESTGLLVKPEAIPCRLKNMVRN